MLPALALLAFLSYPRIQSTGIELQDFQGDPGFKAKVDGKDRTLVLCPRWPLSYMTNGDGKSHAITLAGKPLLNATFQPLDKASMFEGADGVLGIDSLRKVCLAFDALWQRVEPLSSTKIGLEGAKAYFAKLPAWGGPSKVVKVSLARSFSGAPTIKANIGGVPTTLVMTMSCYNNMLDKTVKGTPVVKQDEWSFMPSLSLAGGSPGWATYATLSEWDAREEGGHGILSLDAFGSRRVIVDFADDAVYVEELAPDARLSVFLCDRSGMPFVIEGEKIKVAPIPGYYEADRVGPMDGSTVKRIAGEPAADWVKDLRSGSVEAVARMTKRFRTIEEDYELDVVDADGNEHTVTIPGRGESEGPGSRWTFRREKA